MEAIPMDMPIEFLARVGRSDTEALREYASHRLSFVGRRFRHRVSHLTVRVVDVNGPRRGVDSRCSIAADLVDGGRLFVEASAVVPFAAIALATRRLDDALRRETGRHAARRGASSGAYRDRPNGSTWMS
jgi:ribosome-associated translation inhibitor RaiA